MTAPKTRLTPSLDLQLHLAQACYEYEGDPYAPFLAAYIADATGAPLPAWALKHFAEAHLKLLEIQLRNQSSSKGKGGFPVAEHAGELLGFSNKSKDHPAARRRIEREAMQTLAVYLSQRAAGLSPGAARRAAAEALAPKAATTKGRPPDPSASLSEDTVRARLDSLATMWGLPHRDDLDALAMSLPEGIRADTNLWARHVNLLAVERLGAGVGLSSTNVPSPNQSGEN